MSNVMAVSEREVSDILRRVIHLEEGFKEMRSDVRSMDGKVDGILSRFDKIDGGLRVAIWFSGFAGAVLMFLITKVSPFLLGALPKI
jgi:hypothetical protein